MQPDPTIVGIGGAVLTAGAALTYAAAFITPVAATVAATIGLATLVGATVADCPWRGRRGADLDTEEDLDNGEVNLDTLAIRLNGSIHNDGTLESRNVQAIVDDGDKLIVFTQREYSAFDAEILTIEIEFGLTIEERVIGDSPKEDEGIHAEMLAISWWLQGNTERPLRIGISRPPCARCVVVLDHFNIEHRATDDSYSQNWVHPYRHAGERPDDVPNNLRDLPQKVTKNREYGW